MSSVKRGCTVFPFRRFSSGHPTNALSLTALAFLIAFVLLVGAGSVSAVDAPSSSGFAVGGASTSTPFFGGSQPGFVFDDPTPTTTPVSTPFFGGSQPRFIFDNPTPTATPVSTPLFGGSQPEFIFDDGKDDFTDSSQHADTQRCWDFRQR